MFREFDLFFMFTIWFFILTLFTGNRKTWARIPAQSKASFFPQKDFSNSLNIWIQFIISSLKFSTFNFFFNLLKMISAIALKFDFSLYEKTKRIKKSRKRYYDYLNIMKLLIEIIFLSIISNKNIWDRSTVTYISIFVFYWLSLEICLFFICSLARHLIVIWSKRKSSHRTTALHPLHSILFHPSGLRSSTHVWWSYYNL